MEYIDAIEAAVKADPAIQAYRINLAERQGISVGIRDNDVGSVYSPFSASTTTGGSFLVQWADGRLSRGNLDGNSLVRMTDLLAQARTAAYDDPDAAQFLGPQIIPDVPRWSPDVPPLFNEQTSYLFEVVDLLQNLAQRFGVTTLNGGVGASMGQSWLRTSAGLRLHDRSTTCSYSAAFDGILGEGDQWRMVIDRATITTQIEQLGETVTQLRTTAQPGAATPTIILHPNIANSLLSYFVWGNLAGSSVYHGQSAFTIADFAEHRQVLREDLTLAVKPWQPLGPDSFAWTSEGVPSAPTTYIQGGRLIQPLLDLKYARRLNLSPTTPPAGQRSISLTANGLVDAEEILPWIENGLLVLSVLGLHTQDRTSGNYSLSVPQALLISDGKIMGRAKATITGNFFAHLRDPDLQLVSFPEQPSNGLAFPGQVAWV